MHNIILAYLELIALEFQHNVWYIGSLHKHLLRIDCEEGEYSLQTTKQCFNLTKFLHKCLSNKNIA